MKDMIYRQEAIDALNKLDVSDGVGISSVACDLQEKAIRSIENLLSVQPDEEKISNTLYNIYRNTSPHTSAEGVAAIKYYIAEIWREIYGEEGPIWLKK